MAWINCFAYGIPTEIRKKTGDLSAVGSMIMKVASSQPFFMRLFP